MATTRNYTPAQPYENQHILIIQKVGTSGRLTAYIDIDALNLAGTLPANAFKLWVYLDKNANNYEFALSCVDYCHWSGASASTYHRAIQELKNQHYLVEDSRRKNTYIFYEMPHHDKTTDITIIVPEDKVKTYQKEKDKFVF